MTWSLAFLPEAMKDMQALSRSRQAMVKKAVQKVQENPLPLNEGGYGKPLGSKRGLNLTGLLKIKLRGEGIRVVYKLERRDSQMLVIVVGIREDEEVYEIAHTRRNRHNL